MTGPAPTPATRTRTRRRLFWCAGILLVGLLIVLTIGSFRHAVSVQRSDDPRSTTPNGNRALGQLLTDEGVDIQVTDRVDDAVAGSDQRTLLVVASPDRLTTGQAAQLGKATYGRLMLFRPGVPGLRAFGVPADPTSSSAGAVDPGCSDQAATLAGAIDAQDFRATYASTLGTVTLRCYPVAGGAGWLRIGGPFGPVDLVAGGVSNEVLAHEGNAAFGMNVFGAYPRIVWLMGQRAAAVTDSDQQGPGLLPTWWAPMIVQAFVALIVVGVWRGRRLGPILREPLPVTVRASETVEGHGRLYARIRARDRAAEALRAGARSRLARVYGQPVAVVPTEVELIALSAAVAARTGRDAPAVRRLLAGPPPTSDDDLVTLAQHLDRLEQEARQL